MLKRKGCGAFDEVSAFVVRFINWRTEYKQAAAMTRVHTRYREIELMLWKTCGSEHRATKSQMLWKKVRKVQKGIGRDIG